MPSNHLILCHALLLPPSVFPSIRVFSNEAGLRIRCSKYWSFSFSISPSNEHPGLISFRMDWLDLLVVQGTLKSLLQYHSSKASILWGSAFFIVQFSHPYMTTGKTMALTRQTFVGKITSLLFNMLSRLTITFLGAISSVQSLSCVWFFASPRMPGFPVHHQLLEFTQTHVHWVGDVIQPSHPLLSPSPPVLHLPLHQSLYQWVDSLRQVAKALDLQLQH